MSFFYKDEALSFNDNKAFLDSEKNTIEIFQNSVQSVVHVSNIRVARNPWTWNAVEVPSGSGTGWLWDNEGHIVTNFHVVQGGSSFTISFHKDPKQYKAKLIGTEPNFDIAVLKLIDKPSKVRAISRGQSRSLKVGQKAIAIGNPFGLDHTVTSGIISALNRKIKSITGIKVNGMIQTDAAINPGNSGGPLLNSEGEVIGMNTVIYSSSGSSAGVGFAVPVDTVKNIVPRLIKYGKIKRPGIGIQPGGERAKEFFAVKNGVVIAYVIPRGPSDKAGLRGITEKYRGRYKLGDIILSIKGKHHPQGLTVNSGDDLINLLYEYRVGDKIEVVVKRGKKIKKVSVTLGELPNE